MEIWDAYDNCFNKIENITLIKGNTIPNWRRKAFNAIQIVGPKGCGKTRTAKERCKTIIEFEDKELWKILLLRWNSFK